MKGRTLVLLVIYSGLLAAALWVSYMLRFDFVIPVAYQAQYFSCLPTVILLKLLMLLIFGQFGVLLSYFRLPDLYRIGAALTVASFLLVQAWYVFPVV